MRRFNNSDLILRSALARVSKDGGEQPKSAVADFGDLRAEVGQARLRVPCIHPSRRAQERAPQDEAEVFPQLRSRPAARRQTTRLPNFLRFSRCVSLRGGSLNSRAAVPPRILCFAFSDRNGKSQIVLGRSKSQCR